MRSLLPGSFLSLALAFVALAPLDTLANEHCVVPDNGTLTADLPVQCVRGHVSAPRHTFIRDGLAPGDKILATIRIYSINLISEIPGGTLGGTRQEWDARIELDLQGIGSYASYHRVITLPVSNGRTDAAPRTPGAPIQSFATDLQRLFTQMAGIGDPDFDLLRVTGGTDFGLPSPGHTTLTRMSDGNWAVDSFFDIIYRVDFVGAPGGPFAFMSGSTVTGTNVQAGESSRLTCSEPDNGTFTTNFPAGCGGYRGPRQQLVIKDGLPPGQLLTGTIDLGSLAMLLESPGGDLGGDQQTYNGTVSIEMKSNGEMAPYARTVTFPISGATQSGPRGGGFAVQGFPTELMTVQGQIVGDPDFDLLRITAGTSFGLPSPGHTTLVAQPGGNWAVDSFFDIFYRIDFVGNPGGPFAGMSGSTTATARHHQGRAVPQASCDVPDIGGTAAFPTQCPGGYGSAPDALLMLNGLPPGEPVLGTMTLKNLFTGSEAPGGTLGGDTQTFSGDVELHMHGTGSMAGYTRTIVLPGSGISQTAQRGGGVSPQSFPTELISLASQIVGDPDFDLLRVTAGGSFGMPSPGHTTLSLLPGGNWAVDSFFDIEYRIDFIGAPGGPFAGMSGSTTSSNRIRVGDLKLTVGVGGGAPVGLRIGPVVPNPSARGSHFALELPRASRVEAAVFDVGGRHVSNLEAAEFPAGAHTLRWDGRDHAGEPVQPGVYFVRILAGGEEARIRVTVAR